MTDEKKKPLIEPQNLNAWVVEQESRVDPPWLFKDLMQIGSAIQVTGPATRGFKTWFGMACAMSLASGKSIEALAPIAPVSVLYLLQEGPARPTADRFRKLERGLGMEIKDLPIWFAHRQPFILEKTAPEVHEIRRFVVQHNIKLVIIDTLAKVNRGDENSSRDVGECMRAIDVIRAKDSCSVMYLHHVGKPPGEKGGPRDIDDETRGSSALAGGYDSHFALRKRFDSQKHLDLTVRSNQLPEKYFEVQWFVEPDKAYFTMRATEPGEVADCLKDEMANKLMPERGYTQADLERLWGLANRSQTKLVIGKLEQEGTIEYTNKQYRLT